MKKYSSTILVGAGLALAGAYACAADSQPADETDALGHHADHGHEKEIRAQHEHADAHHENEASDLDRSPEELFAATCEHGIEAYECDECRYEVGVVRAPAELFEGGLLETTRAKKKPLLVPLSFTGKVRFDERRVAHVSTVAGGIVRKVHVTLGDEVTRGQPLLEIDSVEIGQAQAAYFESRSLFDLARRNHERLAALEGIASEKELLAAEQELATAQIRTEAALGKLTRLGMSRKEARALTWASASGRLVLRSPVDGTVLAMHAVAGEIASAEVSLLTVGDNSALWVWADVYERDVAMVMREQAKQPLRAIVEVEAFPGQQFEGTVDFVSPSMNESSRTVEARIAVPNPKRRLLAGMFADVKILIPGNEEALVVPASSVLEDEGRSFVFVHHHDDFFIRRPVTVGDSIAGVSAITSGLEGDERVVADGAFLMKSDVLRSKMGAGCAD